MASTSAAIWARTARAPCPISTVLARTVALPSACRRTIASDTDGPMLAFIIIATPRARSARGRLRPADRLRGARQALLELAVDRRLARRELLAVGEQVLPAQLDGIEVEAPGRVVEQGLEAQASWGTPKPRNAPPGVVFV